MGVVYVAHDPDLARKVAIKILNPLKEGADPNAAKQRLLREARAMAQVEHPNLCQVFDVGPFEDMVFIAMEFIQGRTLREWRAEVRPDQWEDVLAVYRSAAKALVAVHDEGLVHRDFKPENVMLSFDGRVRVMDLGLARNSAADVSGPKAAPGNSDLESLTQTGLVMGTPAYMAPEQFLGSPATAAADQFSFCVSLFEALYGFRPFRGRTTTEVAAAVLRGKIRLPRRTKVPSWVLDVLLQGLQTDPEARFDSMAKLLEALAGPVKKSYKHPYVIYVSTLCVALAGGALYWKGMQDLERSVERDTAHAIEVHRLQTEVKKLRNHLEDTPENPGTLLPEQIDNVVRKQGADVQLCAKHRATNPSSGLIQYDYTVGADGIPLRSAVFRNFTLDTELARCIRGMSLTWEFPPPEGGSAQFLLTIPYTK